MDQLDAGTMKLIWGISGALIGWVALRMENFGHRLVRLETKLENGLAQKLTELKQDIDNHIDGEEARILNYLETSRRLGTAEVKAAILATQRRKRRRRAP